MTDLPADPAPPSGPRPLRALPEALAPAGLDLWGVADGRPYGHILSGCRSVLVIGSSRALWAGFTAALRADPAALTAHDHPLDDHVEGLLRAADPDPGPGRRWIRCAATEPSFVDFRALALAAGLGWPGRLGLLMHPRVGPWLGLRAACFAVEELAPTGPLPGPGPCAACPAPCAAPCPAGAVPAAGAPFRIQACAAARASGACAGPCAARRACPEGATFAYDPLEQHYHDDRTTGRPALAAALGVPGDSRAGCGPRWAEWAALPDAGAPAQPPGAQAR